MSEEKKYMSTGSAPGTCCPDQKYVNGICQGCGLVKMSKAKNDYNLYLNDIKHGEIISEKVDNIFIRYIKELEEIKKIYLKADDFKLLISGKIISKDGVDIALADFGYIKMLEIIAKEMDE